MLGLNREVVNILKTLYSESQIYHHKAPINGSYPMVVYNNITMSPSLRADNKTGGYRSVYRISVIDIKETPCEDIVSAFENEGWLWEGTNITEDVGENEIDEVYTSIDVSILKQI